MMIDQVTFREAEAARSACVDATPVIDGRRANCNLASLGLQRSKPSTPNHGYHLSIFLLFKSLDAYVCVCIIYTRS